MFSGTPGANRDILDLKDTGDQKFWNAGTKALPHIFDLHEDNLLTFIRDVKNRSFEFGWSGLFYIFPKEYDDYDEAPPREYQTFVG